MADTIAPQLPPLLPSLDDADNNNNILKSSLQFMRLSLSVLAAAGTAAVAELCKTTRFLKLVVHHGVKKKKNKEGVMMQWCDRVA